LKFSSIAQAGTQFPNAASLHERKSPVSGFAARPAAPREPKYRAHLEVRRHLMPTSLIARSSFADEKSRCSAINRPEIVRLNAIMKEKFRRRGVILPERASARATASLVRAMSCVDRDAISLEAIHNAWTVLAALGSRQSSAVCGDICRPP